MVLGSMVIDAYIIVDHDNAGKLVSCLVQLHLKHILGHLKTKWHMQESVSARMHIEGGQI